MSTEKVLVKNMTNSPVTVISRALNFRREWPNKGMTIPIEKEVLEQLLYEPGIRYMIDSGILYIEDMEAKKELGIEPEDATEPVNIIVLSDKQRRQYMVNFSLEMFKEKVDELSYEQVEELADYAIENKLMDYDKCEYLKEKCGRDVIAAIRLNNQAKEG